MKTIIVILATLALVGCGSPPPPKWVVKETFTNSEGKSFSVVLARDPLDDRMTCETVAAKYKRENDSIPSLRGMSKYECEKVGKP